MAQSQPPQPAPELVILWRTRLEKAKATYALAVAEFRRLSEEYREQEMPRGDSGLALRRAIADEDEARRQYTKILKQFTELIVNGKPPSDD